MKKKKWKIIQTDHNEYIVLSDSNSIKKIKGKDATDMIAVLALVQEQVPIPPDFTFSYPYVSQKDRVNDLLSWLTMHQFIYPDIEKKMEMKLDIIGEFGVHSNLLQTFIKGLPDQIKVSNVYNISEENIVLQPADSSATLTLLVGPYFYNAKTIQQISLVQQTTSTDFLFVELFENGILLGPLMNHQKGTVCLNCIEMRKMFNATTPAILMEQLLEKERIKDHPFSVWEIGSFSINTAFIYNELHKIMIEGDKTRYNKAVFVDFHRYHNQYLMVLGDPSCEFCNDLSVYCPL